MKKLIIILLVLAMTFSLEGCGFSSERRETDPKKIKYADSYDYEKLSLDIVEKAEVSIFFEAKEVKTCLSIGTDRTTPQPLKC